MAVLTLSSESAVHSGPKFENDPRKRGSEPHESFYRSSPPNPATFPVLSIPHLRSILRDHLVRIENTRPSRSVRPQDSRCLHRLVSFSPIDQPALKCVRSFDLSSPLLLREEDASAHFTSLACSIVLPCLCGTWHADGSMPIAHQSQCGSQGAEGPGNASGYVGKQGGTSGRGKRVPKAPWETPSHASASKGSRLCRHFLPRDK